jgi:hypothetical protein
MRNKPHLGKFKIRTNAKYDKNGEDPAALTPHIGLRLIERRVRQSRSISAGYKAATPENTFSEPESVQ